MTIIDNSA